MTANGMSLAHVVEAIVEENHLTSEHRVDGRQARFFDCPHKPCITWRQWLIESGWAG